MWVFTKIAIYHSRLQRINSRNPLCKGFNPKNSDDDKFANLNETNDSIVDEVVIFVYFSIFFKF